MAIYHATCKPISRRNGHSVTAKAAYIGCKKITDNRTGEIFNYSKKQGFLGGGVILPQGINLEITSSDLWNMAESAEQRKDARVGREWEIGLPHELNSEQRHELAKSIAMEISNRYSVACEYALHAPSNKGDQRNFHVHIITTTRKIKSDGKLYDKSDIELENKEAIKRKLPTTQQQIKEMRAKIASITNQHLELAGLEERVSHLSYVDQGIDKVAGIHKGKAVTEMERRGIATDVGEICNNVDKVNQQILTFQNQIFSDGAELSELQKEITKSAINAESNVASGEISNILSQDNIVKILQAIEYHDSLFTKDTLHKHLRKSFTNYRLLNKAIEEIISAKSVVSLGYGDDGKERFTTALMLAVERDIQSNVTKLQVRISSNIDDKKISQILSDYELLTGKRLTDEQNNAVRHIVGKDSISCIVGRAGTGKSFSLSAAKEVWDSCGNEVYGIALSGIASDGLSKDAKINSRTVASFLLAVEHDSIKLNSSSVIVMDEAGMTDSISMQKVISIAEKSGAKLVLVGDPAQLQPVGPGASFRAILEKTGFVEIQTVYRQNAEWQRQATVDFSQANTGAAIQAYYDNGCVKLLDSAESAMRTLASDWNNLRRQTDKDISRFLVVAHRNVDVKILNTTLRDLRVKNHEIADGYIVNNVVAGKEREIKIAQNDRIIFLRNDKKLGVANGRFATISYVNFSESGKVIDFNVKLDGRDNEITIDPKTYNDFDYGYAATVHKTQGVTVDHSFVYGGGNLNSSLTYVAMTRHKESTGFYASTDQYTDLENLKVRVSRLDVKDSVLNYIDELDDYASRRGIETSQGTFKQIIVESLKKAKDRVVELFTGQKQRLEDLGLVAETSSPEPSIDNKAAAKVVAEYVKVTKDYAMATAALKPKLADLGFENISFKPGDYVLIQQIPEYADFRRVSDLRNELAYKIASNLEGSAIALQLNEVNTEKLMVAASKHEAMLRVNEYVSLGSNHNRERCKLAFAMTKDLRAHYGKLTDNKVNISLLQKQSNAYIYNQIKLGDTALSFTTFDSAVKGYIDRIVEKAYFVQMRDSCLEDDLVGRRVMQRQIDVMQVGLKEYAVQFEKMYGDELANYGGYDAGISIAKLGGGFEMSRRLLEGSLSVNDYSAISRQVAFMQVDDYISSRNAWLDIHNKHLPLIEKCKTAGTAFEKTSVFPEYLKLKITFGEESARIVSNFKQFERSLSITGIKLDSLEKAVTDLGYDKALQMGLDYLSLQEKGSRQEYELAYALSTRDSVTEKLGIDVQSINTRRKELLEACVIKKAGIEPLSSELPGSAYTDIVENSRLDFLINEEKNLQKFVTEYIENSILVSKLVPAKICAPLQIQKSYTEAIHSANSRNKQLVVEFQKSGASRLMASKYDQSKYSLIERLKLGRGDLLETYQRALQGKLTSEDYMVINSRMNAQQSLSLSMSQNRGIKR